MHSSVIVNVKFECAYALDFSPFLYPFHFCVLLAIMELEVLELVKAVAHYDQGVSVDANGEEVSVEADHSDLVRYVRGCSNGNKVGQALDGESGPEASHGVLNVTTNLKSNEGQR